MIPLELTCTVRASFEYYPERVNFGEVVRGRKAQRRIEVWDGGFEDVRILEVRASGPEFAFEVRPVSEARRRTRNGLAGWEIRVDLSEDATVGPLKGTVRLRTSSPRVRKSRSRSPAGSSGISSPVRPRSSGA